jgi:hypothetical protein
MLIPPMPPDAVLVDNGIVIPVAVGVIPVIAIAADVIASWSISIAIVARFERSKVGTEAQVAG